MMRCLLQKDNFSIVSRTSLMHPLWQGGQESSPALDTLLALALHANAFTEMRHRTLTAHGRGWLAAMLAQCHQRGIVGDPVLAREFFAQSHLGVERIFGFDIPPAVRNTMYVRVHT